MGQSKCSKFLPPATLHFSHLRPMEILTFYNTTDLFRISPAATAILATNTSALSTGVIKQNFHMIPEIKTKT